MVGGQVLDLSLEQGAATSMDVLLDMHARKTAALFAAAAEMGAVAGGADDEARRAARDFGRALGLLFQAVDDVLDVTGDSHTLGKTPGKDASLERATIVTTAGLDGGRQHARELAREAQEAARRLAQGDSDRARRLVDYVLARKA
jgi:geranylgeranyl pyrophosphate synthase